MKAASGVAAEYSHEHVGTHLHILQMFAMINAIGVLIDVEMELSDLEALTNNDKIFAHKMADLIYKSYVFRDGSEQQPKVQISFGKDLIEGIMLFSMIYFRNSYKLVSIPGHVQKRISDLMYELVRDKTLNKAELMILLKNNQENLSALRGRIKNNYRRVFPFNGEEPPAYDVARGSHNPVTFFAEHYAKFIPFGLRPHDLRRNKSFYRALHTWCSRHGTKVGDLFPALSVHDKIFARTTFDNDEYRRIQTFIRSVRPAETSPLEL